ncbi:MAG: alpha-ketoglutarate-dependent 2,4-dichlorophenoxyacetate dioxygenase [Acidimicrobiia bacterium]|nr:alpha-ketoglutarate-dependent 2,4-dichlorophenoxyacetate dioxygenase [Acidimicrobiia bacterium]
MATATMTVRAFPTMGAEVTDVDLRQLAEPALAALFEAWWQYGVLVFPGQHLTDHEQVAFSLKLGRLERLIARKKPSGLGRTDKIGKLSNIGRDGRPVPESSSLHLFLKGNQYWHADSSFKRIGAKASMLSAWAVPSSGGETEWADMRQAYDALPAAEEAYWSDKVAVHWYWYSQSLVGGTDVLSPEEWAALPPARHPVVRTHPDSGRRSLYIGRHASHLIGVDEAEGRRKLQELRDWATQPKWVHTHRWAPGDAVLWDNRSVLHRGRPWPAGEARVMKRTTVAGDGDNEWAIGEA